VVAELRSKGVDAWPAMGPRFLIKSDGLVFRGNRVLPLGMVPNTTIVDCNESGTWSIFRSDEHGFRNPRGLYREGRADLVLIGDSFAQGQCLVDGEDLASQFRRAGFKALTLGAVGDGPLAELGTLTEYGRTLRPKVVLWMYYEGNDLEDLAKERKAPSLLRYLDDSFSQNLIEKRALVDQSLKAYITTREKKEIQSKRQGGISQVDWSHVVRLWHLRKAILYQLFPPKLPHDVILFSRVLAKANERVRNWGGRLYFVYLPSLTRYTRGDDNYDGVVSRNLILSSMRRLGLPIIDFTDVLSRHPDPLSLFPFRRSIHYTPEGYELLSETIISHLQNDEVFPFVIRD